MKTANLPLSDRAEWSALFVLDHFLGRPRVERLLGARRRQLKERIAQRLSAQGTGRMIPVDRVGDLSPDEFFRRYGEPGVPVVFTDVARSWKACREWSFDTFRDRFGDEEILLVNHKFYGEEHSGPEAYEQLSLRDFIDQMRAGSLKYARFHPLLDRHPELLKDMDQAWLSAHMYGKTTDFFTFHTLFIGGAGTKTPIHCAGNDNLFLEVQGTKRWLLWPTEHTYVFDPEANRAPAKSCDLKPFSPALDKYPAYAYVDTWTVDLGPGELLYVPPYVWHYVENLTPTIGVGTRWAAMSNTFKRSPLFATMDVFNTNPTMFQTIAFNEEMDFNDILMRSMGLGDRLKELKAARKARAAARSSA